MQLPGFVLCNYLYCFGGSFSSLLGSVSDVMSSLSLCADLVHVSCFVLWLLVLSVTTLAFPAVYFLLRLVITMTYIYIHIYILWRYIHKAEREHVPPSPVWAQLVCWRYVAARFTVSRTLSVSVLMPPFSSFDVSVMTRLLSRTLSLTSLLQAQHCEIAHLKQQDPCGKGQPYLLNSTAR